jgi:hypothetical protein
MTLDQILDKIARSGSASATVSTVKHGNPGGAGDFRIITLTLGSDELRFRQETSLKWVDEAIDLADALSNLQPELEKDVSKVADFTMARGLEDSLGSSQYEPGQIDQAKQLLRKYGRSLGW